MPHMEVRCHLRLQRISARWTRLTVTRGVLAMRFSPVGIGWMFYETIIQVCFSILSGRLFTTARLTRV